MMRTCRILYHILLVIFLIKSCHTIEKPVLLKCCPFDQNLNGIYSRGKINFTCVDSDVTNLTDIDIYDKNFEKSGKNLSEWFEIRPLKVLPSSSKMGNFVPTSMLPQLNNYLIEDGRLVSEEPNSYPRWSEWSHFCVDHINLDLPRKKTSSQAFYVHIGESRKQVPIYQEIMYCAAMLTSAVFLFLVLLVYLLLPQLRNLGGMILVACVASLLLGYLSLSILKIIAFMKSAQALVCKILFFIIYFSFLSTFFWTNVMSFDIYWTFRGFVKRRKINNRGETHKFRMYALYAWGVPFLMSTLTMVLNELDLRHVPWLLQPQVPQKGCFIRGPVRFYYLYVPMLILTLCNTVLFLLTSRKISYLFRDTSRLSKGEEKVLSISSNQRGKKAAEGTRAAHRSHKFRFMVYVKLSLVMGISWYMEAAVSFNPHEPLWYRYLFDGYNMLLGPIIFYIFICKRKVYRLLKKRLSGSPASSRHGTSTSTSVSSTVTSASEDEDREMSIRRHPKGHLGL